MREISFNEHFLCVWEIAKLKDRGTTQTEFLKKCGFPKQRFSHWKNNKQNLTSSNFIKLLEGIGVDCQTFESLAKTKLSPQQKEECELRKWERQNKDLMLKMMRDEILTKKTRKDAGL